jgi:hypothetical protein
MDDEAKFLWNVVKGVCLGSVNNDTERKKVREV